MFLRPPRFTLSPFLSFLFFFFNDTATTEIYTLSLHDALPICIEFPLCQRTPLDTGQQAVARRVGQRDAGVAGDRKSTRLNSSHTVISYAVFCLRTEEHTSELQSHSDLVCRLLLGKKKAT